MKYEFETIEKKWQTFWEENKIDLTEEPGAKQKYYSLDMFSYPSGEGLHMGHARIYTASDVFARYKKMNNFAVLHTTGWDAFGLPAEQYAIKNKTHPRIAVETNTKRFKEQMKSLAFSYDWEREINTTDPKFYKWTQWAFIKMFEKGLAYESFEPINWCPSCKTGLANEDLEDGRCERCGSVVEKKPMRQWVLRITDYAERLLSDLELLKWTDSAKESQRNWIGKSEGAEIDFAIRDCEEKITVFTTRADTLFGATYVVLAPEHELIHKLENKISNISDVKKYIEEAAKKTEIDRTAEGKEKTGVRLEGVVAINPANNEEIPVYIADYVLGDYGTGAVMAVPNHDERDMQFAQSHKLDTKFVIDPRDKFDKNFYSLVYAHHADYDENKDIEKMKAGEKMYVAYTGQGYLVNSGKFNDLSSEEAKKSITEFVGGKLVVKYKLRDWVFSRQRYWGEPIPIIHCEKCGVVAVPEKDLPVELPNIESYEPTGTGESPLADISDWVNVDCPKCGAKGKRETNTMPQWAGSSWYYLRYIDPNNNEALVDTAKEKQWMPVDMYIGGNEHITRHLIYARFWHKFLFDIGAVSTSEPFMELRTVGLILAGDGRKMSKRWGNVVNPDEMTAKYGADALRIYMMFIGPFAQPAAFLENGVAAAKSFLNRIGLLAEKITTDAIDSEKIKALRNQTIKKVGDDIRDFRFNTAVSCLMIYANALSDEESISKESFSALVQLLAPIAPHFAEELWRELGNDTSIFKSTWPSFDEKYLVNQTAVIAIQINGKTRDTFEINSEASVDEIKVAALKLDSTKKWIGDNEIKKVIVVKGKIINIVI